MRTLVSILLRYALLSLYLMAGILLLEMLGVHLLIKSLVMAIWLDVGVAMYRWIEEVRRIPVVPTEPPPSDLWRG
jgi:hypothetical protein